MTVLTNAGATLIATAMQTNGANVSPTWIAVGTGIGTLTSALTSGVAYTKLAVLPAINVTVNNGQPLTLIDALGDTQQVIASGSSVLATGIAGTITVSSFTAGATFAVGSGVANTPSPNDTALQNEAARVAAIPGATGAAFGESLNAGFVSPATAVSGTYIEVGYYGGSATITPGSGTLMARDIQWWLHVASGDSAFFQLDSIIS